MARYLTLFQYSPQAQAELVAKPQDRSDEMRKLLAQVDGELLDYYYCFGTYDGAFLWEVADDITSQAITYAIAASGAIKEERTINLLTAEEHLQVLQKANQLQVRSPAEAAG